MNNYINYNNGSENTLFDPYEGFIHGNLFSNLYSQYLNYKPISITPDNEKDYDMLLIQAYLLATHDLTLYLDNHPDDSNYIKLRSEYVSLLKQAINTYENKYGALDLSSSTLSNSPWGWDSSFPWEVA